jgi:hypothetical protein
MLFRFAGLGAPSGVGAVELPGGIALHRGPGLTDDDGDWRRLVDRVRAVQSLGGGHAVLIVLGAVAAF